MSAVVMDGKALAAKVKARALAASGELARQPGLAVILVGENPASQVYVRGKVKDCADCGIACFDFYLSADTTEEELLSLPQRYVGQIKDMMDDEDVVQAIKDNQAAIIVTTFESKKFKKTGYDVEFTDR